MGGGRGEIEFVGEDSGVGFGAGGGSVVAGDQEFVCVVDFGLVADEFEDCFGVFGGECVHEEGFSEVSLELEGC